MKRYTFLVTDADGLWGDMRIRAKSPKLARGVVRKDLAKEVEPNGSLLPKFRLTLRS